VALQEADLRFGDRAGVLDLDAIAARTGLRPIEVMSPGRAHGWHGNLILTRGGELEALRQIALPGLEPRGALVADLRWQGLALRIVATHLGLLRASRLAQARALNDVLSDGEPRSTVMMGDLNEWRMGNRCSLRPLPLVMARGEEGLVRSFPARLPLLPLDRILTTPEAEVLDLVPHDTPLARRASDHLPVRARIRLPLPDRDASRATAPNSPRRTGSP
jgi:endonuclease/exonuclease/phosphatase family metal-dependent hydrolase